MDDVDLREGWLERADCSIHYRYREPQSGRTVVFLHGAGMDGRMFDAQFPAIPAGDGIVCWDARGHGASTVDGPFRYNDMLADLEALLDEHPARDITLVGQSMGGNLAQTFIHRHPHSVSRAVLIDCTANHAPLSRLERIALQSTKPILTAYPWDLAVKQSARACGLDPTTVAYATACLQRIGKPRFIEVMDFWTDALQPDPAYRMPVPALAVLGDHDRSGNIAKALPRLAATDPNVELVIIAEAAHNSNMDQPSATNAAITTLLGTGPAPKTAA